MAKLTISLYKSHTQAAFYVDDQLLTFTKTKEGFMESTFESDKKEVSLRVETLPSELTEPKWKQNFWLFFFISLFNVFNPAYSKADTCQLHYSGTIKIENSPHLFLQLGRQSVDNKGVVDKKPSINEFFDDNLSNYYVLDRTANKRRLLIKWWRVFIWIVFLVALVFVLISLL